MVAFVVNTEVVLPGTHDGLVKARDLTRHSVEELFPEIADDAELCVDEAFTNTLRHTRSGDPGGQVTVRVYTLSRGPLYVDVLDAGPLRPGTRPAVNTRALDPDTEGGRGMYLIDAFTWYWMYLPIGAHGCLCMAFPVPAIRQC